MKILVVSRKALTSNLDEEYFANNNFITIKCKAEEKHIIWQAGHNVLKLTFDDISAPVEGCTLFNERHAQRIGQFIRSIDRSRLLIINCGAGISRSGAIGEVLDEYLNLCADHNEEDHQFFLEHNRHIIPNCHVKRLLRKELGIIPCRSRKSREPN